MNISELRALDNENGGIMVFEIQRKGDWLILETVEYPRMMVYVNYRIPIPEIGRVKMLEACSPSALVRTLEEVEFCLKEYSKILYN